MDKRLLALLPALALALLFSLPAEAQTGEVLSLIHISEPTRPY